MLAGEEIFRRSDYPGAWSATICEDAEHAKHTVTVEEQTLVIRLEQKSAWYDRIGLFLGTPKITVYLPDAQYRALTVTGSTGNVELPQPLAFEHAEISLTTGNTDLSASVSGTAAIRTSTGNIRAADTAVGALDLSATTGAVRVADVTCGTILPCRSRRAMRSCAESPAGTLFRAEASGTSGWNA